MTILLIIIAISVLILVHELGHFLAAKSLGLLVEEFGFGFPPRLFSKKIGETVYSFNLVPFGGFVKIHGQTDGLTFQPKDGRRAFFNQPAWKKIVIILAGIIMNFLVGWLIISAVFAVGIPRALIITDVAANSPAAIIGLQGGDQISDFISANEFTSFIQANKGKEIILNIKRGEKIIPIKVIPRQQPPAGEGALGISFAEGGIEKQSLFKSLIEGLKTSLAIVGSIFKALTALFASLLTQGKLLENFVGPVGIFDIASKTAGLGFVYLLQLLGLISLNLFVLNLLPFPALDGGWLLLVLVEKIKGSPLSPKFERSVNSLGFIILIALMIAVTARDIARLF